MNIKFYIGIIVFLLSFICVFWWMRSQQSDTALQPSNPTQNTRSISSEKIAEYRQLWENSLAKHLPPDEIQKMDPKIKEQHFLDYLQRMEKHQETFDKLYQTIDDTLREQEPMIKWSLEWKKNRPQRQKERERQRQQREAEDAEFDAYLKAEVLPRLRKFADIDDDGNFISWKPGFMALVERQEKMATNIRSFAEDETPSKNGVSPPNATRLPTTTRPEEPVSSPSAEQRRNEKKWQDDLTFKVTEWSNQLNEQYPDIFILPYLTGEEYNEFFPTEESRQMLQRRQTQMQTDVVNRLQDQLSTDTYGNRQEKLSVVREVLSQNWDADFAEAVIKQLQQEK